MAVDGQQRLIFYFLTFYLLFFIMLSSPSFIPPPFNLHNRLVDNCGVGKEEVLLEATMEKHEEPGECISAAHILSGGANNGTTFEGGRGEIKKRTARWLATKVSMIVAADNRVGSR